MSHKSIKQSDALQNAELVNGRSVIRGIVTLSARDAALAREFVLFASESMRVILAEEVRYAARDGYERPILACMRRYIADAASLIARMQA